MLPFITHVGYFFISILGIVNSSTISRVRLHSVPVLRTFAVLNQNNSHATAGILSRVRYLHGANK
jgi:hypothetical protein